MNEPSTYRVVTSGQIKSGYELATVIDAFSAMFKISLDQAHGFVGVKRIIKKDLKLEIARVFVQRLDRIGLHVELEKQASSQGNALSLTPIGEQYGGEAEKKGSVFCCPKCHLEQPPTKQCCGCGIFFDKLISNEGVDEQVNSCASKKKARENATPIVGFLAIGACAVVALMGAFVWKFIAASFGYELALLAWLIGGAVGFTAGLLGAKGEVVGAMCGVLTLVAILGGKYMTIDMYQEDWSRVLSSLPEEESALFRQAYDTQLSDTSSDHAPSYDQWLETTIKTEFEHTSTLELMKETFELTDLVFLLLGVATAFRLSSRN